MSTHQKQLQIITRLIANADIPLKQVGKYPPGNDGEEKRFGLECKDCGIIFNISLNPKGPEPMEVQAFRQYQNHVTAKHQQNKTKVMGPYIFQKESENDVNGKPTGTYRVMGYYLIENVIDKSRAECFGTGLSLLKATRLKARLEKEQESNLNKD